MFRLQRMRQLDLPTLKMQGHSCHVCIKQPDRLIFLPAPKARGRERGSQWHFFSHRRQNIFLPVRFCYKRNAEERGCPRRSRGCVQSL